MISYETIRIKIRKYYIKLTLKNRRKKINNDDFTIISNNCWGGLIYQSYGIKYNTPTVGLFFMAKDYIKFISNLHENIHKELLEVNPNKSKWYNILKEKANFGTYPIGKIGDIEIHFLHSKSFETAKTDWERRKSRINYKKIIYKFSEMNNCIKEDIIDFQNLPLKNKICFISEQFKDLENEYTYVIKEQKKEIKSSFEPFGKSKYVDINNFINQMKED